VNWPGGWAYHVMARLFGVQVPELFIDTWEPEAE
jgi:hypothetical protein